jgi:GGDEF domain-containing protein/predicted hydrocarbon binding protein
VNDGEDSSKILTTVKVPPQFEEPFLRAEKYVREYFSVRSHDPTEGSLRIYDQRYINVRAAAMSVEFFEVVQQMYPDRPRDEAGAVARSLLFDIAHAIGMSDARNFHQRMGVTEPIERLSAGPVHFAYAGWAFVDIHPESAPTPDEDYFLVYDHPYSFESDSWLAADKKPDFPVCVMNAGYSSGWCEESFGVPLVAVEILCRARGDEACRFVMAHPDHIEEKIQEYLGRQSTDIFETGYEIPNFFDRKRGEEELRRDNQVLADNLMDQTTDLAEANRALREALAEVERLRALALDASPLTGLPGGVTIESHINDALRRGEPLAALYVDLDNFKAFNDAYGFLAGNEVIRFTAQCLTDVLGEKHDDYFVGHIGGDDFMALVRMDELHATAGSVAGRFDAGVRHFYGPSDLRRGFIEASDRRGHHHSFPIMTVSMGAVDLTRGAYTQAFQVSEACAEVKALAKAEPRSVLFVDRRGK